MIPEDLSELISSAKTSNQEITVVQTIPEAQEPVKPVLFVNRVNW